MRTGQLSVPQRHQIIVIQMEKLILQGRYAEWVLIAMDLGRQYILLLIVTKKPAWRMVVGAQISRQEQLMDVE